MPETKTTRSGKVRAVLPSIASEDEEENQEYDRQVAERHAAKENVNGSP